VLVTCRPLATDDDRLSDPTAVVEVLSPASETFDRIYKWREYQRIASLRHYVLIEQKERRIEVWSRTEAGWPLVTTEPPDDAITSTRSTRRSRWRRSTATAAAEQWPA
jgi:Uma2 family endonuclease